MSRSEGFHFEWCEENFHQEFFLVSESWSGQNKDESEKVQQVEVSFT